MVVRHQEGEVGIAFREREDHMVSVRLDVLDAGNRPRCARLRVRPAMHVDRVDDVCRVERVPVVEFDALAQLEGPDLRFRVGLPALRELAGHVAVGGDLDEAVAYLPARVEIVGVQQRRTFQAVRRRATAHRLTQSAAVLRFGGPRLLHPDGEGYRRHHAQGGGLSDEFAPCDPAFGQAALKVFQLFHGLLLLMRLYISVEAPKHCNRDSLDIRSLESPTPDRRATLAARAAGTVTR